MLCFIFLINVVNISDVGKRVYTVYGKAFDGAGLWIFKKDFAKNILISGVDNSSSSHSDNRKKNFLSLGEGMMDDNNSSVGAAE